MEVLLDEHILQYCFSDASERLRQIEQAVESDSRPARILPTFELCRAIHFGMLEFNLQPALFRDCWENLVSEHWQHVEGGYLIHVTPDEVDSSEVLATILDLESAQQSVTLADDEEDSRNLGAQHIALTERLRRLHEMARAQLEAIAPNHRAWQCEPPESLPTLDNVETAGDKGLVLDTNFFLELINVLPVDDPWNGSLTMPNRIPDQIVRRFKQALERYGLDGQLIVPISVLEEATRVANRPSNKRKYLRARQVLREMRVNPDKALWAAFAFQPLTVRVFDAFLGLHEQLVDEEILPEYWPHFGDALVLAHGIVNGCPVASAEWIEKHDWDTIGSMFPFLALR